MLKKNNLNHLRQNLNNFFDIKSILYKNYDQKKIHNDAIRIKNLFKKKKKTVYKKKKTLEIWTKKITTNSYRFQSKNISSLKKGLKIFQKNELKVYFKHFLIHGSVASKENIDYWSDLDTFVVVKNEIFDDIRNLISLRKKLKIFYRNLLKFSPYQHHGLILFTEEDLLSFDNNFLPIEALKMNINLYKNEKIKFNFQNSKNKYSLNSLRIRKNFISKSLKKKYYDHHVFGKTKLKIPLQENDKSLKQFISHVCYMLNIPILYLSSINQNTHKKDSFRKFYKKFNDEKVCKFIKKHEYFRKNFDKFDLNKKINQKTINYFGKNYFFECQEVLKKVINKISPQR